MNAKQSSLLIALLASGCAARSTVSLVQAEQAVYVAREAGAPDRAVYEWTLAEQYMVKAREEWGHADYEVADELAVKAQSWAEAAERSASEMQRIEQVEGGADDVPADKSDPVPSAQPEQDDPDPGDEALVPVIESEQIEVPVWDLDEEDDGELDE